MKYSLSLHYERKHENVWERIPARLYTPGSNTYLLIKLIIRVYSVSMPSVLYCRLL